MATFTDELDDVKPTPAPAAAATAAATATAPAATPAPAPAAATTVAPGKGGSVVMNDDLDDKPKTSATVSDTEQAEDLSVDWEDEKAMKDPNALGRCRPSEKGKFVRFAILPPDACPWYGLPEPVAPKLQRAKNHFINAKHVQGASGTYRCLTPLDATEALFCCKKLAEDGEQHFIALVVRYTSASSKDGSFEKGQPIDWELQYVDLTLANFRAINFLREEIDDPTKPGETRKQHVYEMDLVMVNAPDRAFGYNFKRISPRPIWTRNEQFKAEVVQAAKKFLDGKKLQRMLGKPMTNLDWKALFQKLSGGAAEATVASIDDV